MAQLWLKPGYDTVWRRYIMPQDLDDRYVLHVTLTTGHRRRSLRSEVRDEVLAVLRPLLERALAGEYVAVPGVGTGYTMRGARYGRCCTVTVYAPQGETARPQPVPVLTIGVAGHSRCGARLWRSLHESAAIVPTVTSPDQTPPEPWVADRLEIGAVQHLEAMHWTGDWSRCMAWTWLEMLDDERSDTEADAAEIDPDR